MTAIRGRRWHTATWGAAAITSIALLAGCTGGAEAEPEPQETPVEEPAPAGASFVKREMTDGKTAFIVVDNPNGGTRLSFGVESGLEVLTVEDGGYELAFKDMNGNGVLDLWEDWRETPMDRARDLAPQLAFEQIADMMLFSPHVRDIGDGPTEDHIEWVSEDNMRNLLNAAGSDVIDNVTWVNAMQALAESLITAENPYIPINISSDPRSAAGVAQTSDAPGISRWPRPLGMAATHDITHMEKFSEMVSAEYRALGITMALDPQIDLATEPRWFRVPGTFGEDVEWATQLGQTYVRGFEGTRGQDGRGGPEAVGTIVKHFAGDGQNEGGRGAHTVSGRYAVFPGGSFDTHFQFFADVLGEGATGVMPAYPILLDGNGESLFGDRVGAAFDPTLMNEMLRNGLDFEGIVVTDWGVTSTILEHNDVPWRGTSHGVEDLTVAERHFALLKTGTDQFGGVSVVGPVLEAFEMWQEAYEAGELPIDADARAIQTGVRILNTKFNVGLFDNPFLDLDHALEVVGAPEKLEAGWQAQLASAVVLRNVDGTIAPSTIDDWAELTIYVPHTQSRGTAGWGHGPGAGFLPGMPTDGPSLTIEILERYFGAVISDEVERDDDDNIVSITAPDLADVDVVLVGMRSPENGNQFSGAGRNPDTLEWYPLSLQWRPYTADGPYVRRTSISGDLLEDGTRENRSYYGNTSIIGNEADLDAFERAVAAIAATGRDDLPLITILMANNPVVPTEIYADSDAIVVGFHTSHQALVEIALGLHEASGRLPITFPKDMDAVERQYEDLADTDPFIDSDGNAWEFGFGLNFAGPIG